MRAGSPERKTPRRARGCRGSGFETGCVEMNEEKTAKNLLKERAYENLRFRIITQELPPGELLKEKELQTHYGIGRTPLREIFIELQRQGLIRRVSRSGTWVAPMDIDFIKEIMEVRIPLEGLAGELAAERVTKDQLSHLDEILAKAEVLYDGEDADLQLLIQYESGFHHTIYKATRNRKLEELLYEFQGISARFWHHQFFTKKQMRKLFEDHKKILEALKKRNGKNCRQLLVNHAMEYYSRLNRSA